MKDKTYKSPHTPTGATSDVVAQWCVGVQRKWLLLLHEVKTHDGPREMSKKSAINGCATSHPPTVIKYNKKQEPNNTRKTKIKKNMGPRLRRIRIGRQALRTPRTKQRDIWIDKERIAADPKSRKSSEQPTLASLTLHRST